jgi:hypothetical protein
MLGRRLAVTFIKDNKAATASTDTMNLDQIGSTVVDTVAGVGTVVVVVASTLTALRVTEHIVKYVFR